ncbi:hypothetical protein CLOSTASPAR_05790 [[Clostridium] asparagiforme DSM 15981]|uniref:Uncharacterized protein n=1 Tax=[Clostridium] asparagiforme DSM 15981 TaxID=518636 RepID=C0D941_9FIRM|nr:hypothetical protein CLOSTASPAR_05790 [[Clostridium] asparagiforme DSM 15981]
MRIPPWYFIFFFRPWSYYKQKIRTAQLHFAILNFIKSNCNFYAVFSLRFF